MKNSKCKKHNDILVSIILTESTTSLLELNIPCIEEICEVYGSKCVIKPMQQNEMNFQNKGVMSFLFRRNMEKGSDEADILSDVAYFSDNYKSDSELSVSDDDEYFEIDEPLRCPLKPMGVYTRPLVTIKSVAHDNKIFVENNEVIVCVKGGEDSMDDDDLICRICHGGESLGDLLSPCRCKGSIALAHIECLEHWLRESSNSYCELCKHHFKIIRKPRYNMPWSILVYLSHPGDNLKDLLLDMVAFIIYTPSALVSTYMLMHICENIAKSQLHKTRNVSAHIVAFCAIFGMAAIDFTYSSWLIVAFQRQAGAWRAWYRNNSFLKLLLPEWKKKPHKVIKSRKAISDKNID